MSEIIYLLFSQSSKKLELSRKKQRIGTPCDERKEKRRYSSFIHVLPVVVSLFSERVDL